MQVVSALHTYTFIDAFLNIRAQLSEISSRGNTIWSLGISTTNLPSRGDAKLNVR